MPLSRGCVIWFMCNDASVWPCCALIQVPHAANRRLVGGAVASVALCVDELRPCRNVGASSILHVVGRVLEGILSFCLKYPAVIGHSHLRLALSVI